MAASTDTFRMKSLVRKADIRIVPLLSLMYMLNYLDRGNLGNAKVLNSETGDDLLQKTGMTSKGYAISLTLFSIAYTVFEVPSNWIIKRFVRPSIWLSFLLFGWGLTTIGFAGVRNYTQVAALRVLIGIFEAGFFPGIIYYTTFWYRIEERGLRIAFVAAHANLAGAFGGVIAYGVGNLNHRGGLEGFRWLFIIEGIITVLFSLVLVYWLPDYPSRAKWLTEDEKAEWDARLREQGGGYSTAKSTRKELMDACFSPRMLTHYIIYVSFPSSRHPNRSQLQLTLAQLLNGIPLASGTCYTATIVTSLGYQSIEAQLLTIPPWVVGYIFALLYSFSADRLNARGYHVAFGSMLGAMGWLTSGCLPSHAYLARYGCLVLASAGAFPCVAPLSAWVSGNSPSIGTVALTIGLNNSAIGVGQVIAQWIWKDSERAIGYPTGNFVCAACGIAVSALCVALRWWYGRMNREKTPDSTGSPKIWAY